MELCLHIDVVYDSFLISHDRVARYWQDLSMCLYSLGHSKDDVSTLSNQQAWEESRINKLEITGKAIVRIYKHDNHIQEKYEKEKYERISKHIYKTRKTKAMKKNRWVYIHVYMYI